MAYRGKNQKGTNVKMTIDLDTLDMIISYTLSDNPLVNKRALLNLKRLVEAVDKQSDNFEAKWRFDYLSAILEGELEKNLYRNTLLREFCASKLSSFYPREEIEENLRAYEEDQYLRQADIEFINEYVEERLTYLYLFEQQDNIEIALQNLKGGSDRNIRMGDVNKMFENIIMSLSKDMQMAKAASSYASMDFSLGGKNLESTVQTTINDLNTPTNHIKTGVQYLNTMIDGGFENGRCYLIFALPKSFKSGLMLNVGLWACKYNDFVPRDPEKIPTVLYVSQENSIKETLQRTYTHITGDDIKDTTIDQAVKLLKTEVIGDRNVDFEVRYRPHKSISTNDLDAMIDELELEGKEVVMIIHDYSKRIRSSMNYPDIRLELGEVINDYATIAKVRNIPVVSAGQLNREAYRIIETSQASNRSNLAKELNKSHVGESALMIENTDYAFIINPEEDMTTHEKFLGFKLIASRAKESRVTYFLQKFENGMKLEEDLLLKSPKSLDNMGDPTKEFDPNAFRAKARTSSAPGAGGATTKFSKLTQVDGTNEELDI